MNISSSLASNSRSYSTLIQGNYQESKAVSNAVVAHNSADPSIEIPRETLSKAVLDKQSDGSLRWMTFTRSGFREYQIFANEERLDTFLNQNELVDIWEVEDRREKESKTLYKQCDGDEVNTFSTKEPLYHEIASTTDHGVFCIQDLTTQKNLYVQQRKRWLRNGFDEVSLEEACQTIRTRETSRTLRGKTIALVLATLTSGAAIVGIGRLLSRESVKWVSPLFVETMQKTTHLATAALMAYGMREISQTPALPAALLGALSLWREAEAQSCPELVGGYDTPGSAVGVAVSGTTAYVADGITGLQIIDVSNKANPVRLGLYDTSGRAKGVALSGTTAYVADGFAGLQIIDVSNKTNPVRLGGYDTPDDAEHVAVSGTTAYVADGITGLQIIDVSNKTNPVRLGECIASGVAYGVAISGTTAYVAELFSFSLQIIDVSNKTNPVRLGEYVVISDDLYDVAISGTTAYVAGNVGLQIIDVSNKTNPVLLGGYVIPGFARRVAVSGTTAYVADGGGLQIIDVSNKTNPVRLGGYDTPGSALGVAVSGTTAYVADQFLGLQIIDLVPCTGSSSTASSSNSSTSLSLTTSSSSTSSSNSSKRTSWPLSTTSLHISSPRNASIIWIGLGAGLAGLLCIGLSGGALVYLIRRRHKGDVPEVEETGIETKHGSRANKSFELDPIVKPKFTTEKHKPLI